MKGRIVVTTLVVCFLTSICFSQMYDPTADNFGRRGGSSSSIRSTLSGTVLGADGKPINNARIEIQNAQTGNTVASGYTTQAGTFEFGNLPTGMFEIIASQGIAEARERLQLPETPTVTIQLRNMDPQAAQADGTASVSVAEYKVPQKARDAYRKAEAALAKNHPEEAAKQLAKALEIYSNYAPALTLRGVLSLDAQHPEPAIDDFDKAIHADPSYALAYTTMAAALNQLKKFDDALRSASRAVALAPRSWQSYFEMAKASIGKADYQEALKDLTKSQTLNSSDYAPIHLLRAHVMLALKNYSDAMNELQTFLALAPEDRNSAGARATLEKLKAFTATATAPGIAQAAR